MNKPMGMSKRGLAGILCAALCAFALSGCGADATAAQDGEYEETVFAMDTYMTLTAYGENAEAAVEAGVEEIQRLDALLSTGDADSEIAAVNAAGGGLLSEEVAALVRRALDIGEETDGIFDISVYPLMQLWGFATGEYHVPTAEEREAALALVDASRLTLTENAAGVSLSLPDGMQIDLGGIGKGYSLDRVAEIFAQYGVEDAVINLGGDVHLMGHRSDGTDWRVGIRDPEDADGYLGGLALSDICVVTSGGYERYFEDEESGTRYHHIIDPRTGEPANAGLISVSVVSEDGTMADALSTALFVMGTEDAIAYCEAHGAEDGFGALLMTENRELYITEDLADSFIDLTGDTTLHVIEAR